MHGLSVRESARTVRLEPAEARILLQTALDSLKSDATSTLQVSEHGARVRGEVYESVAGTVSGLVIASPRDTDRKALLRSAGLEAGMRLTAIDGEAVPGIEVLIERMEAGLGRLDAATEFSLLLQIERGVFERVSLRIMNAGNN